MQTVRFGDEKITSKEIMIAVPSMLLAAGIIALPRKLAEETSTIDGAISILIAGILALILTWLISKLASQFPNQSFLAYTSTLVTKPVAMFFTFLFIIQGILVTAFQVRSITFISHQYLFDETPVEVVGLSYLLVVLYAVAGSRAGIFRLNVMFLPIIILATYLIVLFSIGYMEMKNILPVFKTDMKGYVQGVVQSSVAFTGVGIIFFYMQYVKDPKNVPMKAAIGTSWVIFLTITIYVTCIAVFGQPTTEVIRFPVVELAKTVKIPGGFLERLESLFFVIWLMTFFTTTAMATDVTVLALQSIFTKVKKVKIIFFLSPLIYFISMLTVSFVEIERFGMIVGYLGFVLPSFVVIILSVACKIKGRKANGKK